MASPIKNKQPFLDELVSVALNRTTEYGIALSVLETESMPQHVGAICDYLTDSSNTAQLEGIILVGYLRVLASDKTGQCLAPVETYLVQNEIGPYWNSLIWALWPHHPDLFTRAQVRYFATRPSNEWKNSAIAQAFLTHPQALALVKSRLTPVSNDAWQELRIVNGWRAVLWSEPPRTSDKTLHAKTK